MHIIKFIIKQVVLYGLLISASLSAFAIAPAREALNLIQYDELKKEALFSTQSIPAQGSVVVRCEVKLPDFYRDHFAFYVSPKHGDFGQIKEQYFYEKRFVSIPLGSKIYTTNYQYGYPLNTTIFYITRVKQSNEAIVIDLTHMPDGTTANCTF
ncbi:MAG: hypothetical protein P1U39_07515 [Legionellaceae bacterium]|nr:hypothetical protein [Legionellaceae bacterium]